MILIPQRLFGAKEVTTVLRDDNICILSKTLHEPVLKREGYISNHVISIVISGEQHIRTYEDELLIVKAGEVLFIPRGMYCISDLVPQKGTFKSLLFYFDNLLIQDFLATSKVTEVYKKNVPSHLKFGMVPTLQLFADALMSIYSQQQLKSKQFLDLKIIELLHLLSSLEQEQQFANFLFQLTLPKKRNIKNFMEANFDKPLRVADYAYLTGRSLSSFRRDFKYFYSVTPQKWLKDRRLDKALAILNKKEISITELGFEIGYENISYFIKEFKGKFGLSPKQYVLSKHKNFLE